jgi:hypothetical protein
MKDMNSLSPLYGAMTGKAPRAGGRVPRRTGHCGARRGPGPGRSPRAEGDVYLGEDLPCLLTSPAATRQITAMARAVQARVERCASALDAGCVMAPSTLGSDLAGSVK